jgi:RNA polymerase sigma-70 factor (ECF subfamily)
VNDFSKYSEIELSFLIKSEKKDIAKKAFDEIYYRYSSRIYTLCYRFVRDAESAKDIFQETFIKFYETATTNNEGVERIGGYLAKIARNLCINQIRNNNKVKKVDIVKIRLSTVDNDYEKKQQKEVLDLAIEQLPEIYREMLILKEYMDYSYDEIALMTNQTRTNVGVLIHRAKIMLREVFVKMNKIDEKREKENYGIEK